MKRKSSTKRRRRRSSKKGTKGLGTPKKSKGGRICPAGHAFRKKKVGGRKKWVCVKVKKARKRRR